MQNMPLQLT